MEAGSPSVDAPVSTSASVMMIDRTSDSDL